MPGLVGYTNETVGGRKSLEAMVNVMGDCVVDRFFGRSLHAARLHLGVFNAEKQPIWNEDGTLGIMIYGKIYGYEEEMERLKDLGHKIAKPDNDAEFILHAYEEWGNNAFVKLNGSYALIIFSDQEGRLTIVNDRFGTRPIYYALKEGNLIFASTVRAILEYPYPKVLNEKTIVKFFRYGRLGILGDDTWFEGVHVMPSASFLEFYKEKIRIRKYWDLVYSADYGKREELFVEELVRKFKKAVNMRIDDNVKFGVSLSGGLDSRSVCAAMNRKNLSKVHAYTFGIKDCSEFRIAKSVARELGFKNHTIVELNPEDLASYAEKAVRLSDGLDIVSASYIPYVYEKIREIGIKVFLQGFAFDLTLGGSYMDEQILQAENVNDLALALDKHYTLFSLSETEALLGEKLRRIIHGVQCEFAEAIKNAKGDSIPNKADYFALNTRVRRFTIMGSVIGREFIEECLPTIDNEVIDVILKIPPQLRFGHRIYKKFLSALNKKLASIPYSKTMIPANAPDIFWRFGTTYLRFIYLFKRGILKLSGGRICLLNKHSWFDFDNILRRSSAWKKLLAETILNDESLCYKLGYLNREFARKLVKEHYSGIRNSGEKIAFLVTFELFLRMYFKE